MVPYKDTGSFELVLVIMNRLVDNRSPWATQITPERVHQMSLSGLNNPFNRYALPLHPALELIHWLQKESLFADSIRCERCDADCHLGVQEKAIDGYVWRCKNRHEISIRRHSFFSRSHMHLQDIINFVIAYAEDQTLWKCSQAAGIGYGTTAVHWGIFCRDLFIEYYMRNIHDMKLSGQVKVNESLFGRRTK